MREKCVQRVVGGVVCSGVAFGALLAGGVPASADESGGAVTGRIWFDRDSDGQQDDGEPGYRWSNTIALYKGTEFVDYYDTDADGRYTITGLAAGTYRVANTQSGVFAETTAPFQDITVADAEVEVNFGTKGGSLRGPVWVDEDTDGKLGPDDWRLAGKTVKLIGPAGLTAETTTDDNGEYAFEDLPNGSNYHVIAPELDEEYTFVAGGDIDPVTGESRQVTVWRGTDHQISIGYVEGFDMGFGMPTFDPNRAKFQVGEEFNVVLPVVNEGKLSDKFRVTMKAADGVEVVAVTGMNRLGPDGESDAVLDPGKTTTVTVRLRGTVPSDAPLTFTVTPAVNADMNPDNGHAELPLAITAATASTQTPGTAQPVHNPVSQKKAAGPTNLASTGASPLLPLTLGAALLLLGSGTLFFVRRRSTRD